MKSKIVMMTCALALIASSAFAGKMSWIGVQGGGSFPTGDLADAVNSGYYIGGTYGMMLKPMMALGADVNYHAWSGKSPVPDVSAWQYTVEGYWMMNSKDPSNIPFIKGGLGAYTTAVKDGDSSTDFGVNIGLGFEKRMKNNKAIGIDALYHYISSDPNSASLFTVGLNFGFGLGGDKGAAQ